MNVTEITVKRTPGQGSMVATADLVIGGDFVIHNIRIIQSGGGLLVAMPNRVNTARCMCGGKYPVNATFCNDCGAKVPKATATRDKTHTDIAHPITSAARAQLNAAVLAAYEAAPK